MLEILIISILGAAIITLLIRKRCHKVIMRNKIKTSREYLLNLTKKEK